MLDEKHLRILLDALHEAELVLLEGSDNDDEYTDKDIEETRWKLLKELHKRNPIKPGDIIYPYGALKEGHIVLMENEIDGEDNIIIRESDQDFNISCIQTPPSQSFSGTLPDYFVPLKMHVKRGRILIKSPVDDDFHVQLGILLGGYWSLSWGYVDTDKEDQNERVRFYVQEGMKVKRNV